MSGSLTGIQRGAGDGSVDFLSECKHVVKCMSVCLCERVSALIKDDDLSYDVRLGKGISHFAESRVPLTYHEFEKLLFSMIFFWSAAVAPPFCFVRVK